MDPNREIELKLSIAPADAGRLLEHPSVRALARAEPEIESLQTVYYDGRDLPLAACGISLRLRRAGGRQWQTVKLGEEGGAGLFARAEIEVELPGEERPDLRAISDEAVRERVEEILAGQRLEPIFETAMERVSLRCSDDVAEWTFSLDRGEVRAGFAVEPICEVELELRRGPGSHLFEIAQAMADVVPLWPAHRSKAARGLALRTGARAKPVKAKLPEVARDATLRDALVAIARSCLAQIAENGELAYAGEDPEGVHQMRIGLRRMRALVTLARRAAPSPRLGRLRASLRWLAALLGAVRDLDVLITDRLDPLVANRPEDAAFQGLREDAASLREERRAALREALHSRRHAQLMLELGHWVATLEEQPLDRRGGEEADDGGRSEAIPHELTRDEISSEKAERAGDDASGHDASGGPESGGEAWGGDEAHTGPLSELARPVQAFADQALARLDRKARKRAEAALDGSAAARHALRIALKKLRYVGEFFRGLYGAKEVKKYLKRLARLQDLLGSQNDVETASRLLREILERSPSEQAIDLARAAGFLEGYAVRDQEHSLRELAERWERFAWTRLFWDAS